MAQVAFVGLGHMGLPMARNLRAAGHDVIGFDISAACRENAEAAGIAIARSLTDAVGRADTVVTMLPEGRHVRSVYADVGGVLATAANDALLIDCSTIDVETARAMAVAAALRGLAMLDAPVSGGVAGAEAGMLTFMAGGEAEAFARAAPLLSCMGKTVVHAGSAGAGQAAKICNNMMLGIQMLSVCEAMVLARRLGLSVEKLFEVSSKSSGQCWSLTSYCPVPGPVPTSPANRGYKAGFTAAMMLKDLKLAQDAAHTAGAHTPMGAQAHHLFAEYAAQGKGGLDFSAIIEMIEGAGLGPASGDVQLRSFDGA